MFDTQVFAIPGTDWWIAFLMVTVKCTLSLSSLSSLPPSPDKARIYLTPTVYMVTFLAV